MRTHTLFISIFISASGSAKSAVSAAVLSSFSSLQEMRVNDDARDEMPLRQ